MPRLFTAWLVLVPSLVLPGSVLAAGTLDPVDAPEAPIEIRAHAVRVSIRDGFARTEVRQTFFNPNPRDLEAVYGFPVPESASLAEVSILAGERELAGEVIDARRADALYRRERDAGRDAGLALRDGYRRFGFAISRVPAGAETRVRFVYYQPLELDAGVGRYHYPLEEGGTDDGGDSFWRLSDRVRGAFSAEIELESAWPVADVRVPGFEGHARVERRGDGHVVVHVDRRDVRLDRDLVFYYRLREGLPGRVELLAHRPDPRAPGTFMLVVTPGDDLAPLEDGADTTFVLDVSGSMSRKIATLAQGVSRALRELDARDRFRVIVFDSRARELTQGPTAATRENVESMVRRVAGLRAGGSTNLYDALALALTGLDADRATSLVLVTDAVANTGVVDPRAFHDLLRRYDVRVFGFLLGNSGNDPLMRVVAKASGGFAKTISNADDVYGQILLAKGKLASQALHDATLSVRGVRTFDVTGAAPRKVYRGQQLVLFGRYDEGGMAGLRLDARTTGRDRTYETVVEFPERASDHPELERLWALARIEELEDLANAGLVSSSRSEASIRDLGIAHQLVTDHTSMVVLDDEAFARHGIERSNRERVASEDAARARRAGRPVASRRVDREQPMFDLPAPSIGGGAVGPLGAALAAALAAAAGAAAQHRRPRRASRRNA